MGGSALHCGGLLRIYCLKIHTQLVELSLIGSFPERLWLFLPFPAPSKKLFGLQSFLPQSGALPLFRPGGVAVEVLVHCILFFCFGRRYCLMRVVIAKKKKKSLSWEWIGLDLFGALERFCYWEELL